MVNDKIKVVWICHFSNAGVRKRLPLSEYGRKIHDFAPWITNLIEEFKQYEGIELHVVSPHLGLKEIRCSFNIEGIQYHFFKADLPIFNRPWPYFFRLDAWTGYKFNRFFVHRILKRIKPDIINLMGAENPYYSSTVLGIKHVPVLVSIQGIYSNEERFKLEVRNERRCRVERRIHFENKYFGVSAPFMPTLIRRDSSDPIFFWNRFPLKIVKLEKTQQSQIKYDFVFFSRMIALKGTLDALEALAIVKRHKPDVTLRMMGFGEKVHIAELRARAKELGIEENLEISGGFALQEDMLKEASKAKFFILPTHLDTIPGALLEAIHLDLPIISYSTGDIPLLNKGDTRVLLCDRGNIASLAQNMIRLLDEPGLAVEMSQKAKAFVEKWFDNRSIAINFVNQYQAVLAHHYHNEPVPDELLYENYLSGI